MVDGPEPPRLLVLLRVLADDRGDLLANLELWDEAADLLSRAFGVPPGAAGADLADLAVRHLVLTELTAATGAPPPGLEEAVMATTPEQRRRAGELLGTWRRDRLRVGTYREHAVSAQHALGLEQALTWHQGLARLDTVAVIEELALGEVVRLLDCGDPGGALDLAEARRTTSMWVDGQVPEADRWVPTWNAAVAASNLLDELAGATRPAAASAAVLLEWYTSTAWRVDPAHRRMEDCLTQVDVYGLVRSAHLFAHLPGAMIDPAFLDRVHFYLPGWETPKMEPAFFTDHYGFVSDYLAEALRELRRAVRSGPSTTSSLWDHTRARATRRRYARRSRG